MKKSRVVLTLSVVAGLFILNGFAFAHGAKNHDKMVPADAEMKKLHAMMPMFSQAYAKMETALERNEIAVLEAEAKKITTAIPDLKKAKPHKSIKQMGKFVEYASDLDKCVVTTVNLAKKGHLVEAKSAFKKVEGVCAACHATFRD